MNADDRESAIEAILADTKTAMTGLPTRRRTGSWDPCLGPTDA
jgi:hypothetical protein